jgi:hypothetical protein
MSKRAALFIGLTVTVGAAFLVDSLRDRSFPELVAYICYFALALLTSSLKVRLPGITGTMSINFLFVLIAIAAFSFTETVILAGMASIVQCLWKAKRRPRALQVAFNIATLAISSGVAYRAAHALTGSHAGSLPVRLSIGACFYFTSNTFLVSGVLSLIDNRPLIEVWKQCYLWSFPYYLVGAMIAGLVVFCSQTIGWALPLLFLPLMFMVHAFYRACVQRLVQAAR